MDRPSASADRYRAITCRLTMASPAISTTSYSGLRNGTRRRIACSRACRSQIVEVDYKNPAFEGGQRGEPTLLQFRRRGAGQSAHQLEMKYGWPVMNIVGKHFRP